MPQKPKPDFNEWLATNGSDDAHNATPPKCMKNHIFKCGAKAAGTVLRRFGDEWWHMKDKHGSRYSPKCCLVGVRPAPPMSRPYEPLLEDVVRS